MTIDEFKKNIAPHMKKGWVAMNKQGVWWWFETEPMKNIEFGCWNKTSDSLPMPLWGFDLDKCENWENSLMEINNDLERVS